MSALATTIRPTSVHCRDGQIWVGAVPVSRTQALKLLEIWRDERTKAATTDDRATWEAARDLHAAMRAAIMESDRRDRESRPPMSEFGASIFSLFGGAR